jgi:NAD(P)-dependent dehydrogenase (short-subunit alcohol dehydrogenase family)
VTALTGKVAVVTGGGSGLGAAICRALAAQGVRVVVADLREEPAAKIAEELNTRASGSARAMQIDVGDAEAAAAFFERVLAEFDGLDILVNNAGTDVTAPIDQISVAQFDRVLSTNLRGPFILSRAALPALRRRNGGDIVNIASTAARRAWPNASAYHASKWGLVGLSHALHAELRGERIRVCALLAGGMRTPFLLERFEGIDLDTLQDPANVAQAVIAVLQMPADTVVPEILVLPRRETSWP